jgi:hypothetical protein
MVQAQNVDSSFVLNFGDERRDFRVARCWRNAYGRHGIYGEHDEAFAQLWERRDMQCDHWLELNNSHLMRIRAVRIRPLFYPSEQGIDRKMLRRPSAGV